MDEDKLKEQFKKIESVLLFVFLGVMFFFGYSYDKDSSIGLLACYISLFGISAIMIVFGTLTLSKDEIREQYKLDEPADLLDEIAEEIEEAVRTIKEVLLNFFHGKLKESWNKIKNYIDTRRKSVLYTPLCIFALLGIMSYFGYSVYDEDKGIIALAFSLFVVYQLQTAPLSYKKNGYIKNSLDKIEEFTETATESRAEAEKVLRERNEFSLELWEIQNQKEQTAMENIANHSELVNIFSGTHTFRDRLSPILVSLVGVLSWIMRIGKVFI